MSLDSAFLKYRMRLELKLCYYNNMEYTYYTLYLLSLLHTLLEIFHTCDCVAVWHLFLFCSYLKTSLNYN